MKLLLVTLLSALMLGGGLMFPTHAAVAPTVPLPPPPDPQVILADNVRTYLQSKKSPLADEAELLIVLKHWKLLIAISAIESQYCKRQLGFNCWGIKGGDTTYRQYSSYAEAIVEANEFIERWQAKGKWLTVHSMLGSYVVPGSANWENTVNHVLEELNTIQPSSLTVAL